MMKRIFYFIIPVIAFALILSNALLGNLIFDFSYDQNINKYSIYIHLQSDWKSSPGNILFDITNVSSNPNLESDAKSFAITPSDIPHLLIIIQISYNINIKNHLLNCNMSLAIVH